MEYEIGKQFEIINAKLDHLIERLAPIKQKGTKD